MKKTRPKRHPATPRKSRKKNRSIPSEVTHQVANKVEKIGSDLQDSGFAVVGKAIRRVGDAIEHLVD